MPHFPTAIISQEVFDILFSDLEILRKINEGYLTTYTIAETMARNPRYVGGTSRILKHFTSNGKHVATTRRISDRAGNRVHWHGKDLLIDELRLVRQP